MISEIAVSVMILCNNANWQYSERCIAPVESFEVSPLGEITGVLESGVEFKQTRITPTLQLFEMEDVRWITNGKTIVYI